MQYVLLILGGVAFAAWLYLLIWHGGFWRLRERLPRARSRDGWPAVAALVPARDEAATIAAAVRGILEQDYPGELTLVVIDDQSSDGTAEIARQAADATGSGRRLRVVAGSTPPAGWAGKPWALEQGRRALEEEGITAPWLWLTDADVVHTPATLRGLVSQGEDDHRDLVSLMVRLSVDGFWSRLLIPPFVYFFLQLYPFAWANSPHRRTAAAAGGCVLVRRRALMTAGGFAAIAGAVIDDCSLAARIKRHGHPRGGRIWLATTRGSASLRPYRCLGEIWAMVSRSAYAQLWYNPGLLAVTVAGMAVLYLGPPLLALTWPWHGMAIAGGLGALAWGLMAASLVPTLRLYGQRPLWGVLLPVSGALYAAMTIDSARAHVAGRGGQWKGRVQAPRGRPLAE